MKHLYIIIIIIIWDRGILKI